MFFVCFLESIYVFCVICPWGNICVSLVFFWRGYVLFSGINSYALYGSFLENIYFFDCWFLEYIPVFCVYFTIHIWAL